ncbi:MAG: hypothetical protein R2739_03595 [Chitinophagales bacterium]|nr:hypothetical protein [Bacteroidota bacterium]
MNNKNDILNELKTISPLLYSIKENEKSLLVPENYFEQLADNALAEIQIESGLLASLKKEKIEIPENYFDTFSDSIIDKIKNQEQEIEQGKLVALPKKRNKIFVLFNTVAVAASIVGAIIMIRHLQIQEPTIVAPQIDVKAAIASLTQDEIYQYMYANSNEFGLEQIKTAVSSSFQNENESVEKAAEATSTIDTSKSSIPEITNEDIDNYLKENTNLIITDDLSTDIF